MQTIRHAIISAAGIGSRLEMNMPKCLVKVLDKRIIEYQLEILKDIEDVRIVVGFKEEEVIETVRGIRDDIIFVRNPNFGITSTLQSIWLASKGLKELFLIMDGDVIIKPESFFSFSEECSYNQPLIAISQSKTEDAVFVTMGDDNYDKKINSFHRKPNAPYEWTGIAFVLPQMIENKNIYVFENFKKFLPLNAHFLECVEIDTPEDLKRAKKILISEWNLTTAIY